MIYADHLPTAARLLAVCAVCDGDVVVDISADGFGLVVEPCSSCISNAELRGAQDESESRAYREQLERLPR
jgi:hypothetical protein